MLEDAFTQKTVAHGSIHQAPDHRPRSSLLSPEPIEAVKLKAAAINYKPLSNCSFENIKYKSANPKKSGRAATEAQ